MHPFPDYCPHWCDREQHLEFALESEGVYDAADVTKHRSQSFDDVLREIRNSANKDIERDGGGSWTVAVHQSLREPFTRREGYATPPLVELHISDSGINVQAFINMTTGEARVLAAQITALCDRVDIGRAI